MSESNTVENAYSAGEAAEEGQDRAPLKPLRWWPAALILLVMLIAKLSASFFEAPPLPVLMLSFMGPAFVGAAIPLWWLFGSRAPWKERLVGFGALLAIAVITVTISHESIQGMGTMIYQVPVGIVAFAVPLILLAAAQSIRLPVAIVSAVIGFGVWDGLQMLGTTGKFQPELASRWAESEEEKYLKELAERQPRKDAAVPASEATDTAVEISRDNADWPDFRGPSRDSVVHDIALKADWDADSPNLVWKTRIGPGWSSFAVANGRLYTQEQRGESEAVVCLDAATGEELWAYEYPGRFWEVIGGAGPRATPTIGNGALFALGAKGRLACLNPVTGKEIWTREIGEVADREPPTWGWSASPLVVGDVVVVHAGGEQGKGLLAFQATDGELAWSAESGDHTYSSAQTATLFGVEGILMLCNQGLRFHSIEDGQPIWFHESKAMNYRATQPLVMGNSILIGTSLGMGTERIDLAKSGSDWKIQSAWTSRSMKPDYNDFVVFGDSLYGFDGNIFASVSLNDGKKQWKRGRYGNGQVVLLDAAGQLLVTSEKGELVLLEANPEELVELAKFPAIEGKTWNHPVVIGARVFLRNGKEAACYELPISESEQTESEQSEQESQLDSPEEAGTGN